MQASVKEDRNRYIGGSDIPAIMGISPFKTRYDLLLEKAGLKEIDFEGNQFTEYGNIMEPKIREHINQSFGKHFVEGKHIEDDIRIHTDGEDYQTILEIKTTSQVHENIKDYKIYLVQLLFYMEYTNKVSGMLAVYNRPDDFNEEFDSNRLQIFTITIDNFKSLVDEINQAVEQFRTDLQRLKENPFLTEEELMPIDLTKELQQLAVIEEQLKQNDELIKKQKELKEAIKNSMQKHCIKTFTTNSGTKITLVEDGEDKTVKKFNEELFKQNNFDLWDEYSDDTIVKGRKGYVKITFKEV